MKTVDMHGKTVDDAVQAALIKLETTRDKVEIEVLEGPNKGLFGILGTKEAHVRVSVIDTPTARAENFINMFLNRINLDARLDIVTDEESMNINIVGNDMRLLIGRRGETLDSIQYLTSLVVNKGRGEYLRVLVDTENYKKKREETLIQLADRLAKKVVKYGRSVTLEPMNPYERRIIHSALQSNSLVSTYSIGDNPNRKVVITLGDRKKNHHSTS